MTCPKCQTRAPLTGQTCPQCGSFLPGNQVARVSGLYARHHPADLRMTADELMAGIVADRGGESELTTLEASYVRKVADLEIVIRLLTSDIARRGLLTPSGRVRNVADKLLAALSTFDRLVTRIGLGRRARDVSEMSLSDYLAHQDAERQAQEAPQPAIVAADEVQDGERAGQAPDTPEGER